MIALSDYDALIFDFGGVILNIDFSLTYEAFRKLGVFSPQKFTVESQRINLFIEFEKGNLSPQQFRNEIRRNSGFPISDQDIDEAWNALLLDTKMEKLSLLKALGSRIPLYLLSNSNQIHYDHYISYIQSEFQVDFEKLFQKAYFSFRMQLIKPEPKIYQYLIDAHNLNPKRTLFIDDTLENMENAQKVGLQTHWLREGEDICSLFEIND